MMATDKINAQLLRSPLSVIQFEYLQQAVDEEI